VVPDRLLAAGVVVVGKSTLPEFAIEGYTANLLTGVTRNPWQLDTHRAAPAAVRRRRSLRDSLVSPRQPTAAGLSAYPRHCAGSLGSNRRMGSSGVGQRPTGSTTRPTDPLRRRAMICD
jgi:hypothetical protein